MKSIEYYKLKRKYMFCGVNQESASGFVRKCYEKLNSELKNSKAVIIGARPLWSTVDWSSAVLVRRGVSDYKPTQIYFEQYKINMHVAFYPPPPPLSKHTTERKTFCLYNVMVIKKGYFSDSANTMNKQLLIKT